jgi:hypothetical protein
LCGRTRRGPDGVTVNGFAGHAPTHTHARARAENGHVRTGGDGSLVAEMGDVAAACGVSGIFVEVPASEWLI